MPEILHLQTDGYELSIWCNDIQKHQNTYFRTITKIGGYHNFGQLFVSHAITKLMKLHMPSTIFTNSLNSSLNENIISDVIFCKPLFFENVSYQFEWIFTDIFVDDSWIAHRLQSINDSFRFIPRKNNIPARLTGVINTGNNVGWLRLPVYYLKGGIEYSISLSFEVLSIKTNMHADLQAMYHDIDSTYPLWRFSLAEKTEQNASKDSTRGNSPLLWLANFTKLREELEYNLKIITTSPYKKLTKNTLHIRMERIKGKISNKTVRKIKEDIKSQNFTNVYCIDKKHLSSETPENKFIKMVALQCMKSLSNFHKKIVQSNQLPDNQRISSVFLKEIEAWKSNLHNIIVKSFLRDIEPLNEQIQASLVLQQKTGYKNIYKIWLELKSYLNLLSNDNKVSMKPISEIYEVWCFLSLKKILVDKLGFSEVSKNKNRVAINLLNEHQLIDGMAGAFKFKRFDGLEVRLAHEQIIKPSGTTTVSYLVTQKPDIILEIKFPDGRHFLWLFDAKYRIKSTKDRFDKDDIDNIDYVPDDAINQMHRYRDSLIHISRNPYFETKSRPVYGAFALYPGSFNQHVDTNPYSQAIEEIGIGAFPLLPDSQNQSGSIWLTNFLHSHLGVSTSSHSLKNIQDRLYLQEPARIPYHGMKQRLYSDLVMTVSLTGRSGRSDSYFELFQQGTAKWYHLPQSTFEKKYKQHIAEEIVFLGLASTSETDSYQKVINKIWPVLQVTLVPRASIDLEQSGKVSNSMELYYLFKLGRPLMLSNPIEKIPHRPISNSMRLTTISLMNKCNIFSELEKVYEDALR